MGFVRFGDMTFEEIARAAAVGAIAVVPTGCTEQQGPHLTVDNDTWFAESLTIAAAEHVAPEITAVVVPAFAVRSDTTSTVRSVPATSTFRSRSTSSSYGRSWIRSLIKASPGCWSGAAAVAMTSPQLSAGSTRNAAT